MICRCIFKGPFIWRRRFRFTINSVEDIVVFKLGKCVTPTICSIAFVAKNLHFTFVGKLQYKISRKELIRKRRGVGEYFYLQILPWQVLPILYILASFQHRTYHTPKPVNRSVINDLVFCRVNNTDPEMTFSSLLCPFYNN